MKGVLNTDNVQVILSTRFACENFGKISLFAPVFGRKIIDQLAQTEELDGGIGLH